MPTSLSPGRAMISHRGRRVGGGTRRQWLLSAGTCLVVSFLLTAPPVSVLFGEIPGLSAENLLWGLVWVAGNLVLITPFILIWPWIGRALPVLERSGWGPLVSYFIAQLLYLPVVVAAFLWAAPWFSGPHDCGLGAALYLSPLLLGCFFGFLLPRVLFADLRPALHEEESRIR